MGPGANEIGLSRLAIMQQVEASLKRLNTDYLDLYQSHSFDYLTPFEETLRAFDDLVRHGKVRYFGASNVAAWQLMKALAISKELGIERYKTLQAYYSLAGRDIEDEIVPLLKDQRLGLLTWSPLAGGLLSGKFTRSGKPNDSRRTSFDYPPTDMELAYKVIDAAQEIGRKHGVSVAQVALAWQLSRDYVTSVIIGARSEAQMGDNLKALDLRLSAEDIAMLDKASETRRRYPGWLSMFSADRYPGAEINWSQLMKE
jgi:aryl-alcohol dehydrogenase-like predicted oxidoreductase